MFVLDMFSNFYLFIYFKLILISFLTSSVVTISQSSYSPSALCFLTQRPSFDTIQFALELAQNLSFIDVFIIVDDNNYNNPLLISSTVRFLQFNETVLMHYGFHRANFDGTRRPCSAWDKALYYFSRQSTHHSFVWFIEEDVFIPSITAFLSLHKLYSSSYDLVTPDIEYNTNGNLDSWYHWPLAPGTFILPWAHGMVCAMGCSRRLLSAVNEYVQWRGYLTFIDIFFHTLAIHDNQMKVVAPVELNTIVFQYKHAFEQIQAKPYNWWHPLKNVNQQRKWRNRLVHDSVIDKNNIFITLYSIENQLNNKNVITSIDDVESQMKNLLVQFELVKGQIEPSDRHQLRDRFLRLATNRSENLTILATLLANHAFKLPENFTKRIDKIYKSDIYIKLEKAIEENKQTILRLTEKNNPTVDQMVTISWLRHEAEQLIRELTAEIRCEQRVGPCKRTRKWFEFDYAFYRYSQPSTTEQWIGLNIVLLCIIFLLFGVNKNIGIDRACYLKFTFFLFFLLFIAYLFFV